MSCKCASVKSQTVSQLVDANPRFVDFLSEKQLVIVENLKDVELFHIQSYLIEGSDNEYSNKSMLVKTLSKKEVSTLLNYIIKDKNYNWKESKSTGFNPSLQFVLKDSYEQFLILYSESSQELGIIDLEGQKTLKVNQDLLNYLTNLSL